MRNCYFIGNIDTRNKFKKYGKLVSDNITVYFITIIILLTILTRKMVLCSKSRNITDWINDKKLFLSAGCFRCCVSNRENRLGPGVALLNTKWHCMAQPLKKCLILGVSKTLEIAFLAQLNQDLYCADRPRLCFKICSWLTIWVFVFNIF